MLQTIKILVTGKVQGVFYRQATREKARELGLSGQVRNLENGEVEIITTGTESQIEQLVTWCFQGPPRAIVTHVQKHPLPAQRFSDFYIIK